MVMFRLIMWGGKLIWYLLSYYLSKEKDTNGKVFELGNGSSFVLKQKEEWAIRINLIFGKLLTELSEG